MPWGSDSLPRGHGCPCLTEVTGGPRPPLALSCPAHAPLAPIYVHHPARQSARGAGRAASRRWSPVSHQHVFVESCRPGWPRPRALVAAASTAVMQSRVGARGVAWRTRPCTHHLAAYQAVPYRLPIKGIRHRRDKTLLNWKGGCRARPCTAMHRHALHASSSARPTPAPC